MKEFLTPKKIAKLEHVTPTSVARWVRQGVFPGARRVGREYRIPLESYRAWRESTQIRRPPSQ
jgi:excisionase family DNA binding protein